MSAPATPTEAEVAAAVSTAGWRWEYYQDTIDVSELGDPPNSREPLTVIRRRIVGQWETYNPE